MILSMQAQERSRFNMALQVGIGGSAFPTHSTLLSREAVKKLYGSTWYAAGVQGEYTLSNTIGLHVGYQITEQYHGATKAFMAPFSSSIYEDGDISLVDHQVPITFFYKISPDKMLYRHFKILAGTSMDWLSHDYMGAPQYRALWNMIIGARYGIQNIHGRVVEIELQYMRSFKPYSLPASVGNKDPRTFTSSTYVMAFHIYYYLLRK